MSTTPTQVRLAVPNDEEDIMGLLRARHFEQGSYCTWSDDLVRLHVRLGITRNIGYIGVIRGDGGVEATIGLFPAHEWYSYEPVLHDQWFYVHSGHRQSDHAKNLFGFAKWVAESTGVQLRITEVGDEKNGLIRFLGRHSDPIGAIFKYDGRPKTPILAA